MKLTLYQVSVNQEGHIRIVMCLREKKKRASILT